MTSTLRHTYQRLCDLPESRLPVKYPREAGYRPGPTENPYNAWCVFLYVCLLYSFLLVDQLLKGFYVIKP